MASCGLSAAVLLTCVLGFSAAHSSCKETCGNEYERGNECQCDYSCILFGECCSDFRSLCTTKDSCKGRCGEKFKRGRLCSCDPDCVKFNQCCADYHEHCDGLDTTREEAEEEPQEDQQDDPDTATQPVLPTPFPELTSGSPLPDLDGFEVPPVSLTTITETTTEETTPEPTTVAATTDTPEPTTLMTTTSVTEAQTEPTQPDTPEPTTLMITTSVTEAQTEPTQPDTPEPTTLMTTTSVTEAQTEPTQTDDDDTNLCNGQPISGVTTLSNGTVVVFRGHNFWVLSANKVPGPAQSISDVWGIPSPIDTVFTRCNCQGKTYIFKGPQYWRYENDNLDPGYPKVVETGFDGLKGPITAALSVPQHNQRKESVYFFKRGGDVQKYSYQFGTNPSCGSGGRRKVHYAVYNRGNRIARQIQPQVSVLGPTIHYRTAWRGFPTTITAAVSIPNRRESEGYSYYVFNRSKSYKVTMNGDRPVIASKPNVSTHSNEVFKCPRKVSRTQ